MSLDFEVAKLRGDGYELRLDGEAVEQFETADAASEMAVRFAQDTGELYSILYLHWRGTGLRH